MNENKFCVVILTHGRADNVVTYKTLKRQGYTGEVFIVIDSDDNQKELYKEKFKDKVCIFNKQDYRGIIDPMDNFGKMNVILWARNAAFDIAKQKGYEYFIELDDDYTEFQYCFNEKREYVTDRQIRNLDKVFQAMVDFLAETDIKSIAMLQGGDILGGNSSGFIKTIGLRRKAMNSFVCSTKRRFNFIGTLNEDVNTYTLSGSRGNIFFTTNYAKLIQKQTQSNKGGLTDIYLDVGTYVKSFYTVICSPFCCKVYPMMSKNPRLHHQIRWKYAVPKILSEDTKKK